MAEGERRLGAVPGPLLGDAAARLGFGGRPRADRVDRELCGAGREGRRAAGGLRSAPAVHRRDHLDVSRDRGHDAPRARSRRRVVRLGRHAVGPVALPVREPGTLRTPFPGGLHLRGGGPDARLVLFAARDFDDAGPGARLPQRDRQRPHPGRRGAEDVEVQGQRGRSVGRGGRPRGRRGALVHGHGEQPVAAHPLRPGGREGVGGSLLRHAAQHVPLLRALRERRGLGARGGAGCRGRGGGRR